MTWRCAIRVALAALRANKLRSGLTLIGIVIGVGAVITMTAIGAGAQAVVERQVKALGSKLFVVMPGSITRSGARLGSGSRASITEDDADAIRREVRAVEAAAPLLRGTAHLVYGNSNWSTVFYGVTADYFDARNWEVATGRRFEPDELAAAAKSVVLGATVSRQLFGEPSNALGQTIRVDRIPMEVIGILAAKGQSPTGLDLDDVVLVPIGTARIRILGLAQAKLRSVGAILLKIRDGAEMAEVEADIRGILRHRHRLQAGQDDDFYLQNLAEVTSAHEESARVMTLFFAAVAAVSLLVGGIGIMNMMLVSVTERTREIGLRMAVGARRRDIFTQFLIEAAGLALIGALGGIAVGIAASYAIAYLAGWHTAVSVNAVVLATAFGAAVGVFFGFYPARRASNLQPIEALRRE